MKYKVAILTRGFLLEDDYQWRGSWLNRDDPESDEICRNEIRAHFLENLLDTTEHGVCVSHGSSGYSVLISGISTGFQAVRAGVVKLSCVVFGMSEDEARRFSGGILRAWDDKIVESFADRSEDDEQGISWKVDLAKSSEFIEAKLDLDSQNEPLVESRRSRPYSNDIGTFEELGRLCLSQRFSDGKGLKVAVGKPKTTESRGRIETNADLYAVPDALISDDVGKKKATREHTAPKRSDEPSKTPLRHSFANNLIGFLFLETPPPGSSNRVARISPRKLSIICGVVATFALGATVGSKWRGASAKKEREQAVERARKENDQEWEAKIAKNAEEIQEFKAKNAAPAAPPN
jgi:hypothetical protein